MAPYFNNSASDTQIRAISAVSYMTAGIAGLIYILLNAKNNQSMFFRFHFFQAILLGIFASLFAWLGSFLSQFLGGILGLFGGGAAGLAMMLSNVLGFVFMGLQIIFLIACVWGIIQSIRGKYAEVPVISKIVRANLRM